jgi:hypothetical protein
VHTSTHHNPRNHRSATYKITHAGIVSQVGQPTRSLTPGSCHKSGPATRHSSSTRPMAFKNPPPARIRGPRSPPARPPP